MRNLGKQLQKMYDELEKGLLLQGLEENWGPQRGLS